MKHGSVLVWHEVLAKSLHWPSWKDAARTANPCRPQSGSRHRRSSTTATHSTVGAVCDQCELLARGSELVLKP